MLSINIQNPSTLDLGTVEDDDFWRSCWSTSSKERAEEQVRGRRDEGNTIGVVSEIDGLVAGGDG